MTHLISTWFDASHTTKLLRNFAGGSMSASFSFFFMLVAWKVRSQSSKLISPRSSRTWGDLKKSLKFTISVWLVTFIEWHPTTVRKTSSTTCPACAIAIKERFPCCPALASSTNPLVLGGCHGGFFNNRRLEARIEHIKISSEVSSQEMVLGNLAAHVFWQKQKTDMNPTELGTSNSQCLKTLYQRPETRDDNLVHLHVNIRIKTELSTHNKANCMQGRQETTEKPLFSQYLRQR